MQKRIVLFVWIFAICMGCPPSEDIYSCKCKMDKVYPNIACNKLKNIKYLQKVLSALKNRPIGKFYLNKSTFKEVPQDIFLNTNIIELNVNNTNFGTMSGSKPIFSGLENTLKILTIDNCFNDSLSSTIDFNHLKVLNILTLKNNHIDIIGNDWFDNGPYSLKELVIENTGGTKLGSRAFFSLINLREIYLDKMELSNIQRTMFPKPATYLKLLRLSDNKIEILPRDIFTDMPKLEDVYLDNNAMKTMPVDTWSPVWKQLDIVFVTGNPLVCDSKLKWIFRRKRPHTMEGSCDSPLRLRHKYLSKLRIWDLRKVF